MGEIKGGKQCKREEGMKQEGGREEGMKEEGGREKKE